MQRGFHPHCLHRNRCPSDFHPMGLLIFSASGTNGLQPLEPFAFNIKPATIRSLVFLTICTECMLYTFFQFLKKKRTGTSFSSCPTQDPPRGICRVMCVAVLKLAPCTYYYEQRNKSMSKPPNLPSPPAP